MNTVTEAAKVLVSKARVMNEQYLELLETNKELIETNRVLMETSDLARLFEFPALAKAIVESDSFSAALQSNLITCEITRQKTTFEAF